MSKLENQIITMLEYLGEDIQYSWIAFAEVDNNDDLHCDTVHFKLENDKLTYYSAKKKDWDFNFIGPKIRDALISQCREKALDKLVDIELANNNLIWCMKDWKGYCENVDNQ